MELRAVVTGAAVRVGRAIALELARAGFRLALHCHRSREAAEETAAACRAAGAPEVFTAQADLADPDACRGLASGVAARFPALELLVNNAAVFEPRPFEEVTLGDWERALAINLRAPFLLAQGLVGPLRAGRLPHAPEGQGGAVVHLCDVGGERPVSGYAPYSVSKAGLAMLVRAMAVELAPGVRTVGVSPGQVLWPDAYPAEKREHLARRVPLGRAGTPEDVARLVRFLALEAPYVNGEVIAVDGGLSCRY